jgi:ferredoxin
MSLFYVTDSNWLHFLHALTKQYHTYALVPDGAHLFWRQIDGDELPAVTVARYRAVHPVKSFFFPVKELVTREPRHRPVALIGVKACDIAHLAIMDAVFLKGVVPDPYYAASRADTVIISADCDDTLPTCFCTRMSGRPFPSQAFDINLSPVRNGFIAETGSKTGETLITGKKHLFQEPQPYHLKERDEHRKKMITRVEDGNREYTWTDPKKTVADHFDAKTWDDGIAATCVECDACRYTCGTCYCFLLAEARGQWERLRSWDSCQSTGYARVAGGANPRKTRAERLRNFYACKLVYRKENYGLYACTGCGRCIAVCQGKIDIRKSLQKLSER